MYAFMKDSEGLQSIWCVFNFHVFKRQLKTLNLLRHSYEKSNHCYAAFLYLYKVSFNIEIKIKSYYAVYIRKCLPCKKWLIFLAKFRRLLKSLPRT